VRPSPAAHREGEGESPRSTPPPLRSLVVPAGSLVEEDLPSFADGLVQALAALGVKRAFGVLGGAIAPFAEALNRSPIDLLHFRHEGGAAFAAIEASLATGEPVVVLATTGPGLSNLLTGMLAARAEGARVIYVSGATNPAQRGRAAFQETGPYGTGCGFFYQSGAVFHHAQVVEDVDELEPLIARLTSGLAHPSGFVAHLGLPLAAQTAPLRRSPRICSRSLPPPAFDPESVARCAELLARGPFVIWLGFGARGAAAEVRALAERTGAHVMCSPRAKGIMPEDHPLFLGVTGLGGHEAVREFLRKQPPSRVLVLGSRLGELTSFWSPEYVPKDGLVHVDIDPTAFGVGYPQVETTCVQAEIRAFASALVGVLPPAPDSERWLAEQPSRRIEAEPPRRGPVRPSYLFSHIQRQIVEGSRATVLTEAGNSFLLGSRLLAFRTPGRYRVSTSFGSMGQAAAGVLGAALVHGKAVAIVGDGAMLMQNEMSTAKQYGIPAIWIVLNDSRYGMIAQGMQSIGWKPFETEIPRVDFVTVANGMGVPGVCVKREADVAAALDDALAATGPFVVDVWIDREEPPVKNPRNQSLVNQGMNLGAQR